MLLTSCSPFCHSPLATRHSPLAYCLISRLRSRSRHRIPVIVQRRDRTAHTRRVPPLIFASRASPARIERVPAMAAAVGKILWRPHGDAEPAAVLVGLPFAGGALDVAGASCRIIVLKCFRWQPFGPERGHWLRHAAAFADIGALHFWRTIERNALARFEAESVCKFAMPAGFHRHAPVLDRPSYE